MRHAVVLLLVLMVVSVETRGEVLAATLEEIVRPLSTEQVKRARERIETFRLWKLTRALELDEQTSALLFPILNRYDRRRMSVERSLAEGMRLLREAVRDQRSGQLKGILDRLDQDQKDLQRLNEEERTDLKRILTVEQQAKYLLFQEEFNREIRQIIAETREKRLERQLKERP